MKNIKRPKRHNRRPAVGNNHPPPNASELWAHVETIKRMRLGRQSWVQISEALRDEGVDVAPVTIYNFLKRYARRARAGTLPLGFAPIDPQPPEPTRQPEPAGAAPLSRLEMVQPKKQQPKIWGS
jgi:hypothetical protein